MDEFCQHIELGGLGIIKGEMKGGANFPDQYAVYWLSKANCLTHPNHPYWNDKTKIKILTPQEYEREKSK